MAGLVVIFAVIVLAVAIAIVLVSRKVSKTRNAALIGRIDSQRARAQAAERVAFRITDIAETAVNEVAAGVGELNDKLDVLMDRVGIEPAANKGKHVLRAVSDDQQGYVA